MASFPLWTRDDDKRFELALVYFMDSPSFLDDIAQYLQKPLEEVTYYYNALLHDVELIHSGKVALPHYPEDDYVPLKEASSTPKKTKGNPWTQEEHRLFLEGVKKYGRSNWKMISREFVKTRTGIQVASHAQKYYLRQELGVKNGKRQSIHDITLESTMGKLDFGKQNPQDDDGSQGSCFGV